MLLLPYALAEPVPVEDVPAVDPVVLPVVPVEPLPYDEPLLDRSRVPVTSIS